MKRPGAIERSHTESAFASIGNHGRLNMPNSLHEPIRKSRDRALSATQRWPSAAVGAYRRWLFNSNLTVRTQLDVQRSLAGQTIAVVGHNGIANNRLHPRRCTQATAGERTCPSSQALGLGESE